MQKLLEKGWKDNLSIEENHNQRGEVKSVSRGYSQLIQTNHWSMDENLKDRDAGRLSFFMLCAVCVQIEYHNMEIIDPMDKIASIYGTI